MRSAIAAPSVMRSDSEEDRHGSVSPADRYRVIRLDRLDWGTVIVRCRQSWAGAPESAEIVDEHQVRVEVIEVVGRQPASVEGGRCPPAQARSAPRKATQTSAPGRREVVELHRIGPSASTQSKSIDRLWTSWQCHRRKAQRSGAWADRRWRPTSTLAWPAASFAHRHRRQCRTRDQVSR